MIELRRFLQNGQCEGLKLPQEDLRDTLTTKEFRRAVLTIAVVYFIIYRVTVFPGREFVGRVAAGDRDECRFGADHRFCRVVVTIFII